MAQTPTVSVVIPCYNGERFLGATLRSVLDQTLAPLEVIVVDDGSTDSSAALAQSFGPRVRVIRQANQGESVARNRGVEAATGDWIAFVDADDLWAPSKLERQLAVCDDSTLAVCTGHHAVPSTATLPYSGDKTSYLPDARNFQAGEIIRNGAPCIPSTVVVRKNSGVRFSEWSQYGEDTMYLLDLCRAGKVEIVREHLAYYRETPGGQSRRPDIECLRHVALEQWIERHESTLRDDECAAFRRKLDEGLLAKATVALHKRDWPALKAIQGFVANRPEYPMRSELLALQRFPRFIYSLRDMMRTIGRVFGGRNAQAARL